MATILVVEDEDSYRELLEYNLRREGFDVLTVASGEGVAALIQNRQVDLIVLDLMLPGMSGTEVCQQVRAFSQVPIIMATAKDDVVDVIVGLELGADDYVTKPYAFRELLARIRAVLRRGVNLDIKEDVLGVGPIEMDLARHELRVNGEAVAMPLREFELLEVFLRNPDRVLTRGQLLDLVWGGGWVGDSKTLDVHVKRVRAKIEADPSKPALLRTVRGLGYKLVSPEE